MSELPETNATGPDQPTRLIRIKEVQYRTGLGRSTIYRWMSQGRFPNPVQLGGHVVAWLEGDIEEWIDRSSNRIVP
ncbi:AlpA family transcriptional regulator [Aurantiacibacter xanthus]|uniref:AlpA family transcriptional regulator n=2 Tax=Aurantiacibacter xanthus TaxID=1784712 RepID=A0A3A1P000_9SPHN|nr:AlpA family transcriptional regulator [Aurantiacibacter xanthus]RIV80151.1 AlpA family transcriptional regulator [Aurantiacibacter xanthus]